MISAKALSRSRIVLESPTLQYKVYGIAKQRQARKAPGRSARNRRVAHAGRSRLHRRHSRQPHRRPVMTLRTVSSDESDDLALLQAPASASFKDFARIRE